MKNKNVFRKIYDEIKYLNKASGALEQTQSNDIAPINEVSSTDDAFFDAKNTKFSLSADNNGRKLFEGQKEYFKDSKVVDESGSLKVMHHGSRDAGSHTFDAKFSHDDTSFRAR